MRPLALICLLLAGCGQSGDLYLPSEPPPATESPAPPDGSTQGQAPATTPAPAPDTQKDKK